MLACQESKAVLDQRMAKCSTCHGAWMKLDDNPIPGQIITVPFWGDRMIFVKGSKIPCSLCTAPGMSTKTGGFSMRIRYLMQYGNIWSEGQYHSTFLLMEKRKRDSEASAFILPQFVEILTGKGYLRKVSILNKIRAARGRPTQAYLLRIWKLWWVN